MGKFTPPNYLFMLNDGRYIKINLVKDFPNYKLPSDNLGDEKWHCTVIKNFGNNQLNIGDVRLIDINYIRKIGTTCKSFYKDNVLYRVSKQTELDNYESKLIPITDNGKLYLLIKNILVDDAKDEEAKKNNIQITYV